MFYVMIKNSDGDFCIPADESGCPSDGMNVDEALEHYSKSVARHGKRGAIIIRDVAVLTTVKSVLNPDSSLAQMARAVR